MSRANVISDFPSAEFAIRLFCDACGHQANLDPEKVPGNTPIQDLHGVCAAAPVEAEKCSIRVIYAGAGGLRES